MKKGVENDQYYTKEGVAKACVALVDFSEYAHIVESAAGRGDFFNLLPETKRIGFDIDPKHDEVTQADFLTLDFEPPEGKILSIGNPPFGKNASLAYAFFEKAAEHSDCIAFILPRTFRKPSMINRLNRSFHLESEVLLDLSSFYVDIGEGPEDYLVPCVYQIWKKKDYDREIIEQELQHPDFSFMKRGIDYDYHDALVKFGIHAHLNSEEVFEHEISIKDLDTIKDFGKRYPELFRYYSIKKIKRKINWIVKPDFVVRRAGAQAGKVSRDYENASMEGNEFIKAHVDDVTETFEKMWEELWCPSADPQKKGCKYDTAGNPSLSKADFVREYKKNKNNA